jgi:hypothetical protein
MECNFKGVIYTGIQIISMCNIWTVKFQAVCLIQKIKNFFSLVLRFLCLELNAWL